MITSHSMRIFLEINVPGFKTIVNTTGEHSYTAIPEVKDWEMTTNPSLSTYQGASIELQPNRIDSESGPVVTQPRTDHLPQATFGMFGIFTSTSPSHTKGGYEAIKDLKETPYTPSERLAMESATTPIGSSAPTLTANAGSLYDKASYWFSSMWASCKEVDPRHLVEAAIDLGVNSAPNRLPVS